MAARKPLTEEKVIGDVEVKNVEKTVEKKTIKKTSTTKKKTKSAKIAKYLVIVESPAKAKTLKKFLGPLYKIEASMGHVRDLPKSEIGVDLQSDFEPKYITIRGKGQLLAKLRKEAKDADIVYLATDPDREGEAIAWHLLYALKLDQQAKARRITFNEITKTAVKKSITEAREIDMDLVDAQQARRILDRVVGYKISPLLWHKVKSGLSAGRVQSVTLKMICDREDEVESFTPVEYWTIEAKLQSDTKTVFIAKYTKELENESQINEILKTIKSPFVVDEIKKGTRTKKPAPPFTTSTLQQEGSKQLGFSTAKTMSVAQQLYEGIDVKGLGTVGLVSYIRTDSVRISDEAFDELKLFITEKYGSEYISETKPIHKSKGRSQDAHEAIRPTSIMQSPESIKESLSKDQYRLYNLIYIRFAASQMMPAIYDTVSVKLSSNNNIFRSSGSIPKFVGFKIMDKKDVDDKEELDKMPEMKVGDKIKMLEINPEQHFTQPPPRFTDASLVKTLEEKGVGRPSTYAPTISTITARNYVTKENKLFYPTELGEIVNGIMEDNFEDIIDVDFTAKLEDRLDIVEDGEIEWKDIIRDFYGPFSIKMQEAEEKIDEFVIKDEESEEICELCGRNMVIKFGRFGKFLACPGFPECKNAKPFFQDAGVACPLCNGKVQIKKSKKGRSFFGCENHPECEFISWHKPTGEKCPICGEYLVFKRGKEPKIRCTSETCSYVIDAPAEDSE